MSQSHKSRSNKFYQLIDSKFKVGKKIGSGSYGQIHIGTNVDTNQTVAIKFEPVAKDSQLQMENEVYKLLKGKSGFPAVYYFGQFMESNVLVMEMLGRNLESVFEYCGRKFSLKTALFITLQLLKRFQVIHQCRIVYRDVKPENFMLGFKTNTIYVIDFGLSKQYMNSDNRHVSFMRTNELIGTSRYMSISAHMCKEQSRRDDLEALGYVFAYFLRGKLPWSGIKAANNQEHNKMICGMKRSTTERELLQGFPEQFADYLRAVRQMEFEAEPNYDNLRNPFKRLFHKHNFVDDGVYDWNVQSQDKCSKKESKAE